MTNIKSSNVMAARRGISEAGILKHFTDKHREWKREEPLVDFLEKHLFFVTVKFNLDYVSRWKSEPTAILKEFSRLHYETSRQLIGNHLGRKFNRERQPLSYAFIDFEGTRSKNQFADVLSGDLPHIHGLTLVKPEFAANFAMAMQFQGLQIQTVKDCAVDPFNRNKGSVETLATYCMKGWRQIADTDKRKNDLWEILPAIKEPDKMPIALNDYRLIRKASNGERRRKPA